MFLHSEYVKEGLCSVVEWHAVNKKVSKVSSLKMQVRSPGFTFPNVFSKTTNVTTWCNGRGSQHFQGCWKAEATVFFMTALSSFVGQNLTWKLAASNTVWEVVWNCNFSLKVGRAGTSDSPRFRYQRLSPGTGTWPLHLPFKEETVGSWLLALHRAGAKLPSYWNCGCCSAFLLLLYPG